ncbi:MAG TPA: hypothetical protein VMU36_13520 [Spirochaetia bacterium]|nr:hypothetical protein [Spirochaetia bacterium]
MSLFYPKQMHGRFGLTLGLTPSLLHERYGLDFGERFHTDIAWRVEKLLEIDRLVWEDFAAIGLGFKEPFPRASIEPFGHRFVPAMFGCRTLYSASEDPACEHRSLDPDEIRRIPAWTLNRFRSAEPVRVVMEQARWVRENCDREEAERRLGFNLHSAPLTSLQNLGSVINTAVSAFGQDALLLAVDDPDLLRAFYASVTDLMGICLREFPRIDGRELHTVFVGDCTVAMISPTQYRDCNLPYDRALAEYASSIGARFFVHQDSGATPHLGNYAALGKVAGIDFGQDTEWSRAAEVFPDAEANCILFPGWLRSSSREEIRDELRRLMHAGSRFPVFSFSILEVDPELARGKIFELHEEFVRAAGS